MDTRQLIGTIVNEEASSQDRIEAIRQLGEIRIREKAQRGGGVVNLGDLSGQEALRQVIWNGDDPVDIRCQAAAVVAKTDSKAALAWCNEMLGQHL
jgi:hypothetical protein